SVVWPIHHDGQIATELAQAANPSNTRLVTPKGGPITELTTAARANLTTPCRRSKTVVQPANRFTSQAPHTASSVLPLAMASDVATSPAAVTFTRNAPTKIAGQARQPSTSNAASAIPAGGHTGDALACKDASINPNLPAMK